MASKNHKYTLLDVQNDDSEINLQFQDFEGHSTTSTRDDFSNNQAVYFNSFPDSVDDDQEQKLLDEEESDSKKAGHSFWTFEYYQQFFDVESRQVGDRIIWSMIPKPGVNFLKSYIRPNPDLYGPFWICITLVFTTAIAGNLSNYLQTHDHHWRYDFHIVTLATSCIFLYAWLIPLLIWGVLLWRKSKSSVSLLELICLYGYSLAIFVPVSLLWMIPLRWLQWCLGIVASVLSGSVLVRTIQPALSHEAKKVAFGLAVLVLVLHAVLALGFMLYFFYPPSATTVEMEPLIKVNNSIPNAELAKNQEKIKENAANDDKETEENLANDDKNQERSEKVASPDDKAAKNPARMKQIEDKNVINHPKNRQAEKPKDEQPDKENPQKQKKDIKSIPNAMPPLVQEKEKEVSSVKNDDSLKNKDNIPVNQDKKGSLEDKTKPIDKSKQGETPSVNASSKSKSETGEENVPHKRSLVRLGHPNS